MGCVDDALLAEPTAAGGECDLSTDELLAQVRDELRALPDRLAAVLRPPAAENPEVDGL